MIPVIIAALQVLNIQAVSAPAIRMLDTIFEFIPNILASLIIITIGCMVARFSGNIVESLIASAGFDAKLSERLEDKGKGFVLSKVSGKIVHIIMVIFFIVESFGVLHLDVLTGIGNLWSKFGLSMGQFRKDIEAAMEGGTAADSLTAIMGKVVATAGQMKAYLKKKNPSVPQSVLDMIPLYLSEGEAEGVRGDIAFAQSCLETGNFTFSGSAVTLSQNNFCGLGVTQRGKTGLSFETAQLGIRAQIQHLKAYASTDKLRNERIDPRFRYVTRGCAPYAEWLGQKENPQGKGWAAGEKYGEKILSILKAVISEGKVQFMESLILSAPYTVRISIPDLNIRRGPGTDFSKTGKFTGVGIFTIVEEKDGWGLLKAYQEKRDGWISLAFTTRM